MKLLILLMMSFSVQAHEMHSARVGDYWIIGTSLECIVTTYNNSVYAKSETPEPVEVSKTEWETPTAEQAKACADLMAAAGDVVKVLKAVPAPNGVPANTRPTKDITATNYTKIRVSDTELCKKGIIKKLYNNKNWHELKSPKYTGLTTLCGKF